MRNSSFVLCLMTVMMTSFAYAEETAPAEPAPAAEVSVAPEAPAVAASAPAPAAEAPAVETLTDNLEFISGEVSAMDEASKSVSVRLYGDEGTSSGEKILKVTVDENTDLTDGEQDRELKSLTVGTEVDVEYDPASGKATYIFVY